MKNLKIYLTVLFFVLLQVSFVPHMKLFGYYPNLVLLLLISLLILKDFKSAILWLITGGLLLELFSHQFFGFYILQFILIYTLYWFVIKPYLHEPPYFLVLITYAITAILLGLYDSLILKHNFLSSLPVIVVYQSLAGFCIYYLMSKLRRKQISIIK